MDPADYREQDAFVRRVLMPHVRGVPDTSGVLDELSQKSIIRLHLRERGEEVGDWRALLRIIAKGEASRYHKENQRRDDLIGREAFTDELAEGIEARVGTTNPFADPEEGEPGFGREEVLLFMSNLQMLDPEAADMFYQEAVLGKKYPEIASDRGCDEKPDTLRKRVRRSVELVRELLLKDQ